MSGMFGKKDEDNSIWGSYEKEKRLEQAAIKIKQKMGKNAILRAMDLEKGATTPERNGMIGGHKA